MKIYLEHISKRFQRHWIFKDVNLNLAAPGTCAILGPNGSGKSTLLRIIAGMQAPSAGKARFEQDNINLPAEQLYHHRTRLIVFNYDLFLIFNHISPMIKSSIVVVSLLLQPFSVAVLI